jgi:NMD protein affecting ribosome stability and mRNA decay
MSKCLHCNKPIEPGREYQHLTHMLCESCFMQRRATAEKKPPRSKTIVKKTDYILKGWLQQ